MRYPRLVDSCRSYDVCFGSLADLMGQLSLVSAFGGGADIQSPRNPPKSQFAYGQKESVEIQKADASIDAYHQPPIAAGWSAADGHVHPNFGDY